MKTRIPTFLAAALVIAGLHAAAQTRAPHEPFRLTVDLSRFRGADDSSLTVELHYAIAQGGLTYRQDSAGWTAAADVTVLARAKDSLVFGDRWLVPHAVQDTGGAKPGMTLVGVYALQLPAGDHAVTVIARDRNGPGRTDSVVMRVPIAPAPTDKPTLSDIEFATSIRQGVSQGPFHKNTLEVIPCVGGLFGEEQKAYYYVEAYGLLAGGGTSDLKVRAAVYDAVGKEVLSRERPKKRSGESAVLVDQVAVSALRSGTYTLVVALLDSGSTTLARSGRKFFVFNPALGIDLMKSSPSPPRSRSLPALPVMVSLPAPPSMVRLIQLALSDDALMVSLPPRPLTTKVSRLGSAPTIVTSAASPLTKTAATSLLVRLIRSLPAVPLTVTVSAWPSPTPVPGVPARSIATCVTPVPVRSPTTMLSAPPRALSWMFSMLLRSMLTVPMSRVRLT